MSVQLGYLDDNGHPRIRIRVTGPNPNIRLDVEALIDTGFTGFVMLPADAADRLEIPETTAMEFETGNGEIVLYILGEARVAILPSPPPGFPPASESCYGQIARGRASTALVGMNFLARMNKLLLVGPTVMLLSMDALDELIALAPKT